MTDMQPAPYADARQELAAALARVRRTASVRAVPPEAGRAWEELSHLTTRWVPVARELRESAAASPADQARWDALITATSAGCTTPSFEAVVLRSQYLKALLRAIEDSIPPRPPIAEVAARITDAISQGVFLPGAVLSRKRLAAQFGESTERVRLALIDLTDAGVTEERGRCHVVLRSRVTDLAAQQRRTRFQRHLAGRLRDQIAAGVYPPGSALPSQYALGRAFVTSADMVSAALHLLAAEGRLLPIRQGHRRCRREPAAGPRRLGSTGGHPHPPAAACCRRPAGPPQSASGHPVLDHTTRAPAVGRPRGPPARPQHPYGAPGRPGGRLRPHPVRLPPLARTDGCGCWWHRPAGWRTPTRARSWSSASGMRPAWPAPPTNSSACPA